MASIKINSTVMKEKAKTLQSIADSIRTITEEMTNEINRLKNAWEGEVAETTARKFLDLKDDFEERFETINSYAEFLENAAEAWERVNTENLQEAQSQKS